MDAARLKEIPSWSEVHRSLLNFGATPKKITHNEIKDILIKRYINWSKMRRCDQNDPHILSEFERELVVNKSLSQYDAVGAVLFAVNGSPPKGYALYIPTIHFLNFYDRLGKRFLIMDGVFIIDNDGNVFERWESE